jgi:phage terminase large subunit-like protein
LVDKIFELYKLDRYEKIGIEETQYTIGLKPFLDDEMRRRNIFLPIVPLKHKGVKKEIRIRGLIPRFESGSIFLIEKENEALEEEMLTFPVGKHDDILDALAYQLEIAQPPIYNLQEIQRIYERRNNPTSFE